MKKNALLIILTAVLSLFIQADIKAQSKNFTIKGVIDTVPQLDILYPIGIILH